MIELKSTKGELEVNCDSNNGRQLESALDITPSSVLVIGSGIECLFSGDLTLFILKKRRHLYHSVEFSDSASLRTSILELPKYFMYKGSSFVCIKAKKRHYRKKKYESTDHEI